MHPPCICSSFYPSTIPPFIHPSTHLSIHPSIHSPIHQSIHPSKHPPIIYPPTHPFRHSSLHLSPSHHPSIQNVSILQAAMFRVPKSTLSGIDPAFHETHLVTLHRLCSGWRRVCHNPYMACCSIELFLLTLDTAYLLAIYNWLPRIILVHSNTSKAKTL